MFFLIYKITNNVNGKVYIGKHQTKDIDDGYMGSGKLIRRAIEKYGVENFEKEIIFKFDTEDEMNSKEAELVTEEFCERDDTYNLCPGGQGGFGYINKNGLRGPGATNRCKKACRIDGSVGGKIFAARMRSDPEFKSKWQYSLSESLKETFSKNGHQWTGKTHTEEAKKKIGEANSKRQAGKNNSQFGTMWITNGTENKKIKKTEDIPEGWRKGRKLTAD